MNALLACNALVNYFDQMVVLESGGDTLLVGQLLIDGMLGRMSAWCDLNSHFKTRR